MAEAIKKPTPAPKPVVQVDEPSLGVEILDNTQSWLTKNSKALVYVMGGVLAFIAAIVGYQAYIDNENKTAQDEMFAAVYFFEADSLNKALKGDGNIIGLETIAENYGGTKAGKLANYYIGAIYLKQGKYDQAIQALEGFSSDDILVQARAYSLEGDAYVEKSDYQQAEFYYNKAANHKPNKFFTPGYLMKLAQIYELHQNPKAASETYGRIITDYFESSEATEARKFKARVDQSLATE